MTKFVSIAAGASLLAGCASSLEIKDASGKAVSGVPFRTAQVYARTGIYEKFSKGGSCEETRFADEVSLPTGALFFANVRPAQFAKTGFALKVNEKGGLAEITLNTEPSAIEAAKNVGELISAVLPILGVAPAAIAPSALPPCDTGPKAGSLSYVPIEKLIQP